MNTIRASVIISFYNNIRFLELVLAGLETQVFRDFEVLVADDGSPPATAGELKKLMAGSPLDIRHHRHERKGWRKNRVLNTAVKNSAAPYLIFIDGDCIPHPGMVEEHIRHRQPRRVIAGRRVYLSERETARLTPGQVRKKKFPERIFFRSLIDSIWGRASHAENGIYIRNRWMRKLINKKDRGLLGSHFSLYKSDLLEVNGFDERYMAAGVGEDTDLEYRLRLKGIELQTVKHMAIQYHLFHPKTRRGTENEKIFAETRKLKRAYTPYGIEKANQVTE